MQNMALIKGELGRSSVTLMGFLITTKRHLEENGIEKNWGANLTTKTSFTNRTAVD